MLQRLLMKAHIHTHFCPWEEFFLLDYNAVWWGESQPIFPTNMSFLSTGFNSKSSKKPVWSRQQTEPPSPDYTALYARREVFITGAVRTPNPYFSLLLHATLKYSEDCHRCHFRELWNICYFFKYTSGDTHLYTSKYFPNKPLEQKWRISIDSKILKFKIWLLFMEFIPCEIQLTGVTLVPEKRQCLLRRVSLRNVAVLPVSTRMMTRENFKGFSLRILQALFPIRWMNTYLCQWKEGQ
jgi:hypothetical protein